MESVSSKQNRKTEVGSIPGTFSAKAMAEILGVTARAVRQRAERERWGFHEKIGRGGNGKLFKFNTFPDDVKRSVHVYYGVIPEELAECFPPELDQERISDSLQLIHAAEDWKRQRAEAMRAALVAWESWRDKSEAINCKADARFVTAWNDHCVPGVPPDIYEIVPTISLKSLYRWGKQYRTQGLAGLLSRRNSRKRATTLTLKQQQFLLGEIAKKPHLNYESLTRSLNAAFPDIEATRWVCARYIKGFREDDPALFAHLRSPDESRSKYNLALGNASEKAKHFLHWLEIDSTPADIICDDGRRYTIIGVIDVFSRKCMFQLARSSNSWGIAALLRRVFTEWGVPEHIVRDHGKDYASKMVSHALAALDIRTPWIPPFSPQCKPHIERVFRTLAHGLEERLPGYIGHNVADRKAIESRRAFTERFMQKTATVEMGITAKDLQHAIDTWTEEIYHQSPHSGINGQSPNAKAASVKHRPRRIDDTRALDILLAPGGERRVGKKGIRWQNGYYWDDALDVGQRVDIKWDPRDAGRVWCFDPESKSFLCEAKDVALSEMTVPDYIRANKRANKRLRERASALKRLARETGDPLADEINQLRKKRGSIVNLPVGDPMENPFVAGALDAAQADTQETKEQEARQGIFDQTAFKYSPTPEPEPDPKVVRFPIDANRSREETEPPDQQRTFANSLERFDYLRVLQRTEEIDDKSTAWLMANRSEWEDYAELFCDQWPHSDQEWIGRLAPDLFEQYCTEGV